MLPFLRSAIAAACLIQLSVALPAAEASPTDSLPLSDPNLKARAHEAPGCETKYYNRTYPLSFTYLGPYCYGGCEPWKEYRLTYGHGGGWSYQTETETPIFFGDADDWWVLDCDKYQGEAKGQACSGGTGRALYAPTGVSPYKGGKPRRFGTVDVGYPHNPFDLLEFNIYPFYDKAYNDQFQLILRLVGIPKNGVQKTFSATIRPNQINKVTVPASAGFIGISAFEISVESKTGTEKWPFAIDNLLWNEYIVQVKPTQCTTFALPTGTPGPCKPKPTATSTITVNFDEFPYQTQLPQNYKGLVLPNNYVNVYNRTTDEGRLGNGYPIPPSGKNYIITYQTFTLASSTFENRFGMEEISVLCSFPPWADPDFLRTNGQPCVVSFYGRRDPYDGSGLPELVEGSITIPNPGNLTGDDGRTFTKVKLSSLTKDPAGFRRLVRFDVYTEIGSYEGSLRRFTGATAAYDNLIVTKELGEGERCRIKGKKTNFDNLPANSFVPTPYDGFRFGTEAWKVTPRSAYNPGTPGYVSVVTQPNSIFAAGVANYVEQGIDAYISPAQNSLFDFISATITVDIPASEKNLLSIYNLVITVVDACGSAGLTEGVSYPQRPLDYFYYLTIRPGKQQIKFARPYRAISKIYFNVQYPYESGLGDTRVAFWIDEIETKKYEGPTPGCARCAFRGYGVCEVPVIPR